MKAGRIGSWIRSSRSARRRHRSQTFLDLLSEVMSKAAATVGNNLSQSEAPTHAIHLPECGRR
jgi:hypothetical protein